MLIVSTKLFSTTPREVMCYNGMYKFLKQYSFFNFRKESMFILELHACVLLFLLPQTKPDVAHSFFTGSFSQNKSITKQQRASPRQIATSHQSSLAEKMVTSAFKLLIYSAHLYESVLNLKFSSRTLLWT